jgi:hypothetical protein
LAPFLPISHPGVAPSGNGNGLVLGPNPILDFTSPPDLAVDKLNISPLGNNNYVVFAHLQNIAQGPGAQAYPGGGEFVLTGTSGGIVHEPGNLSNGQVDPSYTLASMPIPALAPGAGINLQVEATGRAIFTAAAVPTFDQAARGLPEANPNNDSMTVSNLVHEDLPINTTTLNLALGNSLAQAQVKLDNGDSYIKIPGLFEKHFQIPGQDESVGPFTVTYYVNDLESTGVSLAYENAALVLTVNFADKEDALQTPSIAPDISVKNLQIQVTLPLGYDPAQELIYYHDPSVSVNGDWSADGPIGFLLDGLTSSISQQVSNQVVQYFNDPSNQEQINDQLTNLVRLGGRIDGVDVGPMQATAHVDAANPV